MKSKRKEKWKKKKKVERACKRGNKDRAAATTRSKIVHVRTKCSAQLLIITTGSKETKTYQLDV